MNYDGFVEFSLLTINDDITLEYNDTVMLKFNALHGTQFKEELEKDGEFIRDVAYVVVLDNDGK